MVKYWVVFDCSSTHGGDVSLFKFSEESHKKVKLQVTVCVYGV